MTNSTQDGAMRASHVLVIVTLMLMCFTTCCLPLTCAGVYYPSIVSYLGLGSTAELSVYQTCCSITMIIVLPFAGKILTKYNARIVLTASSAVIGLTFIAMSQFSAVWMWYVAGVYFGLGLAFNMFVAVPTLIARWFAQKIGFFVGLCLAFTGIGGIVFNQVAGMLIATGPEGWRLGYLVFGVVCLVCTVPFTLFAIKNKPADAGLLPYGATAAATGATAPAAAFNFGGSAKKAMKTPAFYAAAIYAGLATMMAIALTLLPTYAGSLSATLPATAAMAATLISCASAGQLIGKLGLGAISDKSCYLAIAAGTVCGIAGFLLIWLVPGNVVLFLLGGALFGIFFATSTVLPPIIVRRSFGNADYSNIFSRVSSIGQIFGALANVVWGLLAFGTFSVFFVVAISGMILASGVGFFALKSGEKVIEEAKKEAAAEAAAA